MSLTFMECAGTGGEGRGACLLWFRSLETIIFGQLGSSEKVTNPLGFCHPGPGLPILEFLPTP